MTELDYQTALLLQHQFQQEDELDQRLAVQLQDEFVREAAVESPSGGLVYKNRQCGNGKGLTDPSWEVIDPTPDIHNLFVVFNERFFWNQLGTVSVDWSKRMTLCAGICRYRGRGGICSITLSEPLLKLRPRKDLVETLLHEMIHAYLFVTHNNRDRDGHGPEFHKHMYRINKDAGTNITVYHDFHDEVRLYKQHWWRCNGPCQHRRPFFGMVRRAMNRAPGPNDRWWAEHSRTCNGSFIKVKEPEKQENNKSSNGNNNKIDNIANKGDIRKYISVIKTAKINDNVNTLQNDDNKLKISPVCSKNIYGFANLNKPSTSKSNNAQIKTLNDLNNCRNRNTKLKSNSNSTIVINKKSNKNQDVFVQITPPKNSCESKSNNGNNDDYSVVRNHWLNKYSDNTNKRISPNTHESNAKLIKISNDDWECPIRSKVIVNCPVCTIQISEDELNSHLDVCLNNSINASVKECVICGVKANIFEYENHVRQCAELNFSDKLSQEVVDLTGNEDRKQCSICNEIVVANLFDGHAEKCLLNVYDEIEATFKDKFPEMVSCLACGKQVLRTDLNGHLDECMSDAIFNSKEEQDNINNEFNCPFCLVICKEDDMKAHLDVCLKDDLNEMVNDCDFS